MAARRHVCCIALAAAALAASGCSRRGTAREEPGAARGAAEQPAALDPARPLEALQASADDMAARAGAFAWEAQVSWTVQKPGAATVQATERHRLRQLAAGDFDAELDLDPGTGPGSVTGRRIVFARGMTYARGRWAPFRERPTDRGRDARRHRDDSFRLAADLAALYGKALAAEPAGEATHLGRPARRYVLSLFGTASQDAARAAPPGGYDPETRSRLDFLEGRVPTALEGELLLDAQTSLPLSVTMRGTFSERADPEVRVAFTLDARVKALGDAVAPVSPPAGALTDERKPKGVARALEAAGLRKREAPAEKGPEPEGEARGQE